MSTLLTIGDSVVWGQGLAEEHKTASIIARHLGAELEMLAHAGAKIGIRDSYSVTMPSGEVPCFFPTILQQLHASARTGHISAKGVHAGLGSNHGHTDAGSNHSQTSAKDQANAGNDPISAASASSGSQSAGSGHAGARSIQASSGNGDAGGVRWVLMNGGINDVEIQRVFNPMVPQYELELHTRNYCGRDMLTLLRKVMQRFRNATVLVLGYYPGLSHQSRSEGVELLYSLVHGVRFAPVCEPDLFRAAIVEHCLRFWRLSNGLMRGAVEHANREAGRTRAIFVDSGMTEANAAYAPQSLLWELDLNDPERAPDETAELRRAASELVAAGPLQRRQCRLSSAGHPNPEGAARMAQRCLEALAAGHSSSASA